MKVKSIIENATAGALAGAIIAIFVSASEKENKIKKNVDIADDTRAIEDHWISSSEAINDITKTHAELP